MGVPSIKFNGNPSDGSRADAYGRTDMTKLMVPFRGNGNAPKKKGLDNKCDNTKYVLRRLMTRIVRRTRSAVGGWP